MNSSEDYRDPDLITRLSALPTEASAGKSDRATPLPVASCPTVVHSCECTTVGCNQALCTGVGYSVASLLPSRVRRAWLRRVSNSELVAPAS